jgi:tetratricopeptide (TPR) repeat protein
MTTKNTSKKLIRILLPVLLLTITLSPFSTLAASLPVSQKSVIMEDDFEQAFRAGKDLIDREEWTKATEKFKELISKYPNHKSTAAVLYWLAFSYKKQKAFTQANETLDRLLKEFSDSSWVPDAQVMKIELTGVTKARLPKEPGVRISAVPKATPKAGVSNLPPVNNDSWVEIAKIPLDREDEIKFAAFQSLLSADMKQAIETVSKLLRSDSKASDTLKCSTLRAVAMERLLRPQRLTDSLRMFRDALTKSFQTEPNLKVRQEIIYTLADLYDEWSTRYLTEFYPSGEKEIKKAIIESFNEPSRNVIHVFGLKRVALIHQIESEKLMEILRTEKDFELRRLAFNKLRQIRINSPRPDSEQITAEVLIQLYDTEADEELKISFIRALKDLNQPRTAKKLLEIAKNDKSDKLRLEAIYWLRLSKDPEVIKALAEMIR